MEKIIINGGKKLSGVIEISGAKNSAVALLPAAILSEDEIVIKNVPNISDIDSLIEILTFLEADVKHENDVITINCKNIKNKKIPENISSKLRASYYFMSSLLGRFNEVEMYFPGGCNIGARPIDITLDAFEKLGAEVIEEDNFFKIKASLLTGNEINLRFPSVGATINAMLVAVKSQGRTVINNAAREPEIVNVATLLNNMGAKISGCGSSVIEIEGVTELLKAEISVIPDRIEAGTYVILGALMGEKLNINNLEPLHMEALISYLCKMGCELEVNDTNIVISKGNYLNPINVKTEGYPGFPTDLQQPLTVLLTQSLGVSTLEETIYENRFQNVVYMNKMGCDIKISDKIITINGGLSLKGADVVATDLRAGASLILAGIIADGTTTITEVKHILRGYENIISKLKNVGADIELVNE